VDPFLEVLGGGGGGEGPEGRGPEGAGAGAGTPSSTRLAADRLLGSGGSPCSEAMTSLRRAADCAGGSCGAGGCARGGCAGGGGGACRGLESHGEGSLATTIVTPPLPLDEQLLLLLHVLPGAFTSAPSSIVI